MKINVKRKSPLKVIALAICSAFILGACSTQATPVAEVAATTQPEPEVIEVEPEPEPEVEPEPEIEPIEEVEEEPAEDAALTELEQQLIGYWAFAEGSETFGADSNALVIFTNERVATSGAPWRFGFFGRSVPGTDFTFPMRWRADGETLEFTGINNATGDSWDWSTELAADGSLTITNEQAGEVIVVTLEPVAGLPEAQVNAEAELTDYLIGTWVLEDESRWADIEFTRDGWWFGQWSDGVFGAPDVMIPGADAWEVIGNEIRSRVYRDTSAEVGQIFWWDDTVADGERSIWEYWFDFRVIDFGDDHLTLERFFAGEPFVETFVRDTSGVQGQ